MENFHLDADVTKNLIFSAAVLIGAFAIFFGLKRGCELMAKRLNLPALTFRPVRTVLRYAVLIVAAALILDRFGFNMDTLLAVLGTVLGLIAIGFVAVWSILSNFLCTFVLIMFKPFSIGDELEIPADAVAGKVVDITLIFTVLRNPAGEDIQIPNNIFFQKIFKRRVGAHVVDLGVKLRQDEAAR